MSYEVLAAGSHGICDPMCCPYGMFAYKCHRTKGDISQGMALVSEYDGGTELTHSEQPTPPTFRSYDSRIPVECAAAVA